MGHTNLVEHHIDTGNAKPIKFPPRRCAKQPKLKLKRCYNKGLIEPSNSPWTSPIVLCKKKDNTVRFCVDYRKLNHVTRKDPYPLPRIDESLDSLGGAHFLCRMDLASGYWQLKISDNDKQKTAFATHRGLFQFKCMPFGLANSPATFERLMEVVLSGFQWERCLVYLDDVIVFGKTLQEQLTNLTTVFTRFREANLKLKPKKCALFEDEVAYLGHIVSEHGIKCDPEKLIAINL